MLKAVRVNRWLLSMYLKALTQTIFVAVLIFLFTRVVGQFFSLSAKYNLSDIVVYALGVTSGEIIAFLPFIMMISISVFVLKMHHYGYDQALQCMGYGLQSTFKLIGVVAITVFLVLTVFLDQFGKEQYQQAKLIRMNKLGEVVQVWQKKEDGFYQMHYDPTLQVLSDIVRVVYRSQPEVEVIKYPVQLLEGEWKDTLGRVYDFDPPALLINQIFGKSWLSLGQIIDLHFNAFELGWKTVQLRFYTMLRDAAEILLFFLVLLSATKINSRHSKWREALQGSACIVLAQTCLGGQGVMFFLPLVAMIWLMNWVK
jgi:hypothetical protein